MGYTVWSAPLTPLNAAAGTAVTAAALTAGTPVPAPIIPMGAIQVGTQLRLVANGELTSTSATPTVVLGFYLGAVGGAIGSAAVLAATAALVINVGATAWPFTMVYEGTFRALSASAGVIHGLGYVQTGFTSNTGLTAALISNPFPITAALRTVSTLNTQQNNQIDVGVTLSSVTGSPSVSITDFFAELRG